MITRFFRSFFWAILLGLVFTWVYLGIVSASTREIVLVEDKFDGLGLEPILPGDWSFVSSRVVPERVRLHRIFVGPRVHSLQYKKGLSQSEMLGLDDTYYIRSNVRLEYRIDPARARLLFMELDESDWSRLQPYLEFRVRLVVDRFVKSIYKNDRDVPVLEEKIYNYFASNESLKDLNVEFDSVGIHFLKSVPLRIYVPDLGRYQAMLNLGERVLLDMKLDRLRKINEARIAHDTVGIQNKAYFARLESMGQLLRRYPNLKEYVSLDLIGDQVQVMIVPSDRWLQKNSDTKPLELMKKFTPQTVTPQANHAFQKPVTQRSTARFQDLTPP